jgi:hypothetical protein
MVSASVAEMDAQPRGDSKDRLGIFFHLELMIFCIHTISYRRVLADCFETAKACSRENGIFQCDGKLTRNPQQ